MTDIRQTHQYSKYLTTTGWIIEEKDNTYYFIKRFSILGSVIKLQRPKNIDISYLETLSKKYKAFHIIIEPLNEKQVKELISGGYKLSKNPYLPSKTLLLDITRPQEVIFNNFKNDSRGYITKNATLQFKHHSERSMSEFRQAWKMTVGLKRHVPSLKNLKSLNKTFGKNSLFITTKNMDAGAIFLIGEKTGYYWQAFTSKDGRKSKSQYNIVYEGMIWSKKMDAISFDFEGVYDERFPNRSWLGFTHFKKSFSGKSTLYPGAYTKIKFP